jgi:hypothetical protein
MKIRFAELTVVLTLAILATPIFLAQSVRAAENVAPAPTPGTPSVLPRPDFHFPGNVGRTFEDSDPPTFPKVVRPPKGAPNVLLILIDDAASASSAHSVAVCPRRISKNWRPRACDTRAFTRLRCVRQRAPRY